jgi:hypothetical protein
MVDKFVETVEYKLCLYEEKGETRASIKETRLDCDTAKSTTDTYDIGIDDYKKTQEIMKMITDKVGVLRLLTEGD